MLAINPHLTQQACEEDGEHIFKNHNDDLFKVDQWLVKAGIEKKDIWSHVTVDDGITEYFKKPTTKCRIIHFYFK